MIIRELIAMLGIDMDDADFDKADQTLGRVKQAALSLTAALGTAAIGRAIHSMVEEASGVEETMNVVRETFEGNTDTVVRWAAETGEAVNRSRFSLRKYAADVGAIVKPMLGSADAATEMSTTLAALAVDLASFFNLQDAEAMTRLISGIVGETEAVRRLGVDLSVEGLERFARSQGINKAFKDMAQGEKVALRYQKIMKDTADAQGDAARTANDYANASRGLTEAVGDLRKTIGQELLPNATKLVRWVRDGINVFLRMAEGTRIIKTALIALATVAGVVGAYLMIPFLPAIAVLLAVAAAFAAIVIAAEDVWAFFTGRASVIGHVLEQLGVDTKILRDVFAKFGEIAMDVWDRVKDKVGVVAEALKPILKEIGSSLVESAKGWAARLRPIVDAILEFDLDTAISQVKEFFVQFGGKIGEFVRSPIGKVLVTLLGAYLGKKAGELAGTTTGKALGSFLGKSRIPGSKAIGGMLGEHTGGLVGSLTGMAAGGAGALAFAERVTEPSPPAQTIVSSPQQTNEIHIHGSGDPEATAEAVRERVQQHWDDNITQASEEMLPLVPLVGETG